MSDDGEPADEGDGADGGTEEGSHGAAAPEAPDGGETGGPGTGDHDRDRRTDDGGGGLSDGVALAISLLFGLALATGSVLLVGWLDPGFEDLLRIRPTVAGGGVGAGWEAGNAEFALNLLITLVHLADVVMGLFILVMVFLHWAAFRRLAARMEPPGGRTHERGAPATDGGGASEARRRSSGANEPGGGEASAANRPSSDRRSDGGEASRPSSCGDAPADPERDPGGDRR